MKSLCIALILTFFLIIPSKVFSQNSTSSESYKDSLSSFVEFQGFASSNSLTPFWIQANQFGTVPRTSPAGSAHLGLEHFWGLSSSENNNWRVGLGVEAVGNLNKQSKFLLPQLHATLRFKNWEFFVGRKKQWIGLADSTLGTGSYAWSGNALPIPKIQIGTTKFVAIPFTKGLISFNGFYSDGIFEGNRPITSNLKLHQKTLYLRIGKSSSRVKLYGGFNHQVQWGGKSPFYTKDGQMPHGFKNYINAVTGKAHTNTPTRHDSTGRVGNHLGSIDLGLEIETFGATILLYRQNLYEDGSLAWLDNVKDGLNGIKITRKSSYGANLEITSLVLEFLNTKNQAGSINDINLINTPLGKDNYFNNAQVRDGWSYYDRTIGTPFITPTSTTKWKWPNYGNSFTSNNRVSVFHLGLQGTLMRKVLWTTKLSYSSNAGTYDVPFINSPTQFSGLLTMQGKINLFGGTILKGSVAADLGELYPDTYGFTLGLRKEGLLSR
ncbi:capsule assembly Wzi family protein [Dyadobacter sp. LHD-138]|uniref:capsule assembly Wzi family protein n=1 Tax=Dyadobacter sp. LHD-138 TaxID=3071413 RepID=UPI0027DF71C0|nr:capsule assembly Wzi family protein [Dyadobacter sp. LHD-138]MDQ6482562.1 capsule assembly Wzi family protein [Dyadobacter sp. LHD-138]